MASNEYMQGVDCEAPFSENGLGILFRVLDDSVYELFLEVYCPRQ